jgi:hypothetical protein
MFGDAVERRLLSTEFSLTPGIPAREAGRRNGQQMRTRVD